MMSEFIVHSIPGSPFGRAVLATLEEKHASFGLLPVAPGGLRKEPHISRHPFGRVPVLEHDGFSLYERQAILRCAASRTEHMTLSGFEKVISGFLGGALLGHGHLQPLDF